MGVIDKSQIKAATSFGGQRVDTLIALALLFSEATGQREAGEPRHLLQGLSKVDRAACEVRFVWFDNLSPVEQARWLRQALGRTRDKQLQLDSQIDKSHVVETLRREPRTVQAIICAHLPAMFSTFVARELNINLQKLNGESDPVVSRVVRQTFLRNFARLRDINAPSHTDALTRDELARTLRLIGVRETALACRGIKNVESVAAFVRRFEAADARAILALISTLTEATAPRVAVAEKLLERIINTSENSFAMLDRAGLYNLAAALTTREASSVRYTIQKLPFEIAAELEALMSRTTRELTEAEARTRRDEVETIAQEVRRVTLGKTAAPTSQLSKLA